MFIFERSLPQGNYPYSNKSSGRMLYRFEKRMIAIIGFTKTSYNGFVEEVRILIIGTLGKGK
jgi:hypothetical protein